MIEAKDTVITEEKIKRIIETTDHEDSRVSSPMPITPFRYEVAIAKAQAEATWPIAYRAGYEQAIMDSRE